MPQEFDVVCLGEVGGDRLPAFNRVLGESLAELAAKAASAARP